MELDKRELEENYKSKDDGELLALYSEGSLTNDAYAILEKELTKRGLEIPARPATNTEISKDRPQSLKAHWQGEASLVSAYWFVGVLGGFLFSVLFYMFLETPIIDLVFIAWVPYFIFALVSIWRCAWNAKRKVWGYIARLIVIVNALYLVVSIIGQFQTN
jgi:hypothetical protein